MANNVFMLVVSLVLAAVLFLSIIILSTVSKCEDPWCVIATALVDTAFHIIVIVLLFEPARKYVEQLNERLAKEGIGSAIRVEVEQLSARFTAFRAQTGDERPYLRFFGDMTALRLRMASLTPLAVKLSGRARERWLALDKAVTGYFLDAESREGPSDSDVAEVINAGGTLLEILETGQRAPSFWSRWLPILPN